MLGLPFLQAYFWLVGWLHVLTTCVVVGRYQLRIQEGPSTIVVAVGILSRLALPSRPYQDRALVKSAL